jgi:hypothetical protein
MSDGVCRHKWKLIDKTLMKSAWSRLGWWFRSGVSETTTLLLKEKLVITVQCESCGEIEQYVEVNP